MGIYGILWVLQLDVNTYYLGTIIVLVIKKIDSGTKKMRTNEETYDDIFLFGVPDKL